MGENTENCISFSFPIEEEVTIIDKKRVKITKIISWRLHFIGYARIMAISFSNLVNNLAEGIHKTEFNHSHMIKKNVELAWLNRMIATAFYNTQTFVMII